MIAQGAKAVSSIAPGSRNSNLFLRRADGDLADDRQLPFRRQADDVARGHRRIVDDHARGLGAGLAGGAGDIVDRRGGELGDGGDVVEECDQTGRHAAGPLELEQLADLACRRNSRIARPMLAMDFIKAKRETVERAIRDKGVDLDLDALLALDADVRALKTEIEALRAERNAISALFPKAAPEEKAELGRKAKEAGARAGELEGDLAGKEAALKALMLKLPGIPWEGAPVGPDESFNISRPPGRHAAARSTSSRSTMSR